MIQCSKRISSIHSVIVTDIEHKRTKIFCDIFTTCNKWLFLEGTPRQRGEVTESKHFSAMDVATSFTVRGLYRLRLRRTEASLKKLKTIFFSKSGTIEWFAIVLFNLQQFHSDRFNVSKSILFNTFFNTHSFLKTYRQPMIIAISINLHWKNAK